MDHFSIDLLARERIGDMQREAKEAQLARMKAPRPQTEANRPLTGLRRIVAHVTFAG